MWIFAKNMSMTSEEVVYYAKQSEGDAIYRFPKHILNNADNMLALVNNGFVYIALPYCSSELRRDMDFLKQVALNYNYVYQDDFFDKIDPTLKNNKELLDIFATKIDEPSVKQSNTEKTQLDKLLNNNKKNKHRI